VRNLSRIGYRELLRSGVRIWEWDGPMLHAKTIVADGRWTRVGSSNLNSSSLLGNWELDVLIEDAALAESMERQFRLDIARSREVVRRRVRAHPALQLELILARGCPAASRRRGELGFPLPCGKLHMSCSTTPGSVGGSTRSEMNSRA
jgi:cardiolipin synthase